MSTCVDFMSQPSLMFEPADPTPMRTVRLTTDEFNLKAIQYRKPIEYGETTAILVIGPVMYVTELNEASA